MEETNIVDGYADYFDAEQVAQILGVTRKDIFAWREQGVATPALTKLIDQFDRAGLARMAVYALLRDLMGDRTSRPREIVNEQATVVEAALRDLRAEDALVLRLQGKRAATVISLPIVSMLREGIRAVPR
jgi:hypothetical protein